MRTMMQRTLSLLLTICLLLTMMPAAVLADATGIATGTDLDDPGQNNPGVEVTPGPGAVQAPVQNPGTPVLLSEEISIGITDDNSITDDGTHVQGETLTAVLSNTTGEWSYQWYVNGSAVVGATGVNYTPVLEGSDVKVRVTAQKGGTTLTSANVDVYAIILDLNKSAPRVGDVVEADSPEVTGAKTWNWYLSGQEEPLNVHSESIVVVDDYAGKRLQARLTLNKDNGASVTYYSYLTDVIPVPGVSVMADGQPLNQSEGAYDYTAYYGQTLTASATNVAEATEIVWMWDSEAGPTHKVELSDIRANNIRPLRLTYTDNGGSTTLVERYIQYRIAAPSITIDYVNEKITAKASKPVPPNYVLSGDWEQQTAGCYTVDISPSSEPQEVDARWVSSDSTADPPSEVNTVTIPARPSAPAITASSSVFSITAGVEGDAQSNDGRYTYELHEPSATNPTAVSTNGEFTGLRENATYYVKVRRNAVEGKSFASEWSGTKEIKTSERIVLTADNTSMSYRPSIGPENVPVKLRDADGHDVVLKYGTDYTIQTPFPTDYPSWPAVRTGEPYPCVIYLTDKAWQTYKFIDDSLPAQSAMFYLKITPADIKDASVTLNNDTYDGQVKSVVVKLDGYTLEEGKDKDYTVTLPAGVTEMKNAGTYTVTITGKGNYTGTKEVPLTIAPKTLEAVVSPGDTTYNGTTDVDTSNWSVSLLTDVVKGDDVSASISGVSIADKNAAVNKEAQVFLQLTGDDATNYALPTATTVTFELKKAPLTIELRDIGRYYEGAATGDDVIPLNHIRVYDALPSNSPEAVLVSSLEFDKVTFGLRVNGVWRALRPDEESSTWSVSVADILTEEAQKNYSVESDTVTGKLYIYPRYMPVTLTMTDRAYDGTKKIDYTYSYDSDYELVSDPVDSIHADCTVENAAVGTTKPVWADNVYVVSNGKANYNYNVVLPTDAVPTVDITPKELSVDVTATDKTYDGTCDVKLSVSNVTGICGSDQVTITANGKAVSSDVGEQTVEVNLESNNTNYTAVQKGTTKVNIKKKTLTIGGAATLTYTGKTELSLAGITSLTLDGVLTGDEVNLDLTDATATVADPKVGTGKSAAVQGATLSGAGAGNYVLTDAALCIVNIVKAKAPDIQWPTASAITYGDKVGKSTLTSTDTHGTFSWDDPDLVLPVAPWSVLVNYSPYDTENYDYSDVELYNYTLLKVNKAKAPAIQWPTASAITYGEALSASELTSADLNGTFEWQNKTAILSAGEQTQTVVYTPKDTKNYDYTGVTLTHDISVTVNKAATVIDVSGVQTAYTYTGALQTVNTGAKLNHSEATPVYTNNTFTSVKEGNGLVVTISAPETANYLSAETTVTLTVNKAKAPAIQWPTASAITYGEALNASKLTSADSGTFRWAKPETKLPAGAQKQTVVYTPKDAENYDYTGVALEKEIDVTVNKATAPSIQWPTASAITYGDELSASELTSADLNGTFEWQTKTEILPAGEQTQTVVYTPKDTKNYDYTGVTLTHDISVTVNKAATVIDMSGVQTAYTYTGALQTVNTGAKLNHSEATPVYTNNTFTTVQEGNGLVVTISAPETANYLPAETTVTLTVNKAAAPTIQWPTASAITYGEALSASKLTSADSGSFRWAKPETKLPAGAQKQTVVYTPKDAENYDYTGVALEKEIDVTVNKATAPSIQWPTASAITYGEALSASELTSADLNGTFEWQNKTAILSAGEQTQTVVYTPKDTKNYDYTGVTLTHDISVTVNKAATVIDVSGVQTAYTYTGALQTVNTGAKLNHSEAIPAYSNNTFTTVKEGNGLVVTISVPETANYLSAETTVPLTVNKAAALDIQWPTASAITYGEALSASKLTSADSGTFRWAKPETKLPAGAQKQTVVYTPKDAENYDYTGVALEKEIDVTVNKAATVIDVSGVQTSYTYTGDLQTVNTGATLNHSEAAPVYTNNTFTAVKEGDGLVVTITVPETANYLPAEATVTLKVTRAKAPTIEWPEVSPITYGDPLSKIELKGGSSDLGTFVWEDGSEIPGAGVPTRKLIFTPSDTENYDWPETQFSKDITVQVAKRQVTITIEDAEKTYGDPDPVWEYSVDGLLPGATLSVTVTREKGEAADTYELCAEYTALENYEIQAVPGKLTIHPRSLDELTIDSIPTQRYTGQVLRPRPTIKDGNTELVPDRDYTLTYSGAVGPGKGKITITGKGNYTGERTITFDINDPALDHLRNALGDIGTGTTTRVVIDPQGLPMGYDLIDAPGAGTDPDDRLLLIRANNDTDDTRILSLSGTQLNALVSSRTVRLLAFENAGAVVVLDARDLLAVASDVNLTAEQRAKATYEVRIVPVTEPVAAIDISVWMCWPDGELELTPSLTTLQVGLAVDGANNRTDLCRLNDDGIPEVQDSELMTLPADMLEEGTTMDWYHVTVLPDGTIQITERQREPLSYVRLEVLSTSPAQGGRYLLQERSQNEQE